MARPATGVLLRPQLCDRCGKCVRACPLGLVSISAGYVCVDVSACDGCLACESVCATGAITADKHSKAAPRPKAAPAPGAIAPPQTTRTVSAWSLVDAFAVAAVLLAAMFAKDAMVGSRAFSLIPGQWRTVSYASVLTVFYAVQLGGVAFLSHRHRRGLWDAIALGDPTATRIWRSAASVFLLLVATRAASTLWGAILGAMGWRAPGDSGVLGELLRAGPVGVALVVAVAVVVGPFVEELVFRGVMASALRARFGNSTAILVSAALFSLYHVTPWLFVQMFALGCALAWLASNRRTLWPAIALHALYNAVSIAAWLLR